MKKYFILLVLLLIIVSISLYVLIQNKKPLIEQAVDQEQNSAPKELLVEEEVVSLDLASAENDSALIMTDWYSFAKIYDWSINNDGSDIVLTKKSGDNAGDKITISQKYGNEITDTDAKFGDLTLYYNDYDSTWRQETGDYPSVVSPYQYIFGSIPVFSGTGRWRTYIIPAPKFGTGFIKLNISGSGDTKS